MFTLEKFDEIVKAWMHKHIHNSPVSQNEAAFNHLQGALGALREQVEEHVDAQAVAHVDTPQAPPVAPQHEDDEE